MGEAKILAGSTFVRVTFGEPYKYQPVVTVTPIDFDGKWKLTDVNNAGFTIEYSDSQPLAFDLGFNWHSFASPFEQLTVSDGTVQDITLIVASNISTSPASGILPSPGEEGTGNTSSTDPSVLGTNTSTPSADTSITSGSSTPASDPSPVVDPAPVVEQVPADQVVNPPPAENTSTQ